MRIEWPPPTRRVEVDVGPEHRAVVGANPGAHIGSHGPALVVGDEAAGCPFLEQEANAVAAEHLFASLYPHLEGRSVLAAEQFERQRGHVDAARVPEIVLSVALGDRAGASEDVAS